MYPSFFEVNLFYHYRKKRPGDCTRVHGPGRSPFPAQDRPDTSPPVCVPLTYRTKTPNRKVIHNGTRTKTPNKSHQNSQ